MTQDEEIRQSVEILGLEQIALFDPRLVVALHGGLVDGKLRDQATVSPTVWEIVNVRGPLESKRCEVRMNASPGRDLWVRRVLYVVRRVNSMFGRVSDGSIFDQNDEIDFTLAINSYAGYKMAPTPTPLRNVSEIFECICPAGFVLRRDAEIEATFSRQDDGPFVEPVISMHGMLLPVPYDSCTVEQAIVALRAAGILKALPERPTPGLYKHYRGGLYRVLFVARDHETQEELVVYVPLQAHGDEPLPSPPQVRPLATPGKDSWTDTVRNGVQELPDDPDGTPRYGTLSVPRFTRVGD